MICIDLSENFSCDDFQYVHKDASGKYKISLELEDFRAWNT